MKTTALGTHLRSRAVWDLGRVRTMVAVAVLSLALAAAGPIAGAQTTTVSPGSPTTTPADTTRRAALDAEAADADRTVRLALAGLVVAAVASGVLTWRYVVYTDPAKGYARSRVRRTVKRTGPR